MKKNLLTGLVTGSLVGFAFGCQQSTSILLSSFHDLAVFPLTSLIAIAFVLFLHGRLQSVLQKKVVAGLVVMVASLGGAFFGFLFFTLVLFLEKKKRILLRICQVLTGLSLVFLMGLAFLIIGLTVDHSLNGLPGLPKKAKIDQAATSEKPNVVLLTIDAQRADHLGA